MKCKLEGYWQTFTLFPVFLSNSKIKNYINNNTNNNKNENFNTNINKVKIDFKQIEKNINDMESLTSTEIKEALEKLQEITYFDFLYQYIIDNNLQNVIVDFELFNEAVGIKKKK